MDKGKVEVRYRKEKISKGIIISAILIILYSLHGLPTVGFDIYYSRFYPLPEKVILARYIFSIALRITLIACSLGILLRKDIFRRALLLISFFTIATVYWKHPVDCFKRVLLWKIEQGILPAEALSTVDTASRISSLLCSAVDIGFALCLIYYFTRPRVKGQFQR